MKEDMKSDDSHISSSIASPRNLWLLKFHFPLAKYHSKRASTTTRLFHGTFIIILLPVLLIRKVLYFFSVAHTTRVFRLLYAPPAASDNRSIKLQLSMAFPYPLSFNRLEIISTNPPASDDD